MQSRSRRRRRSSSYYEALRNALQEANRQMGDELTVWKDDVGTLKNQIIPRQLLQAL